MPQIGCFGFLSIRFFGVLELNQTLSGKARITSLWQQ